MQSLLFPVLLAVTVFAIVLAITNAFSRDNRKRLSERLSGGGKPANTPNDIHIVIEDQMTALGRALSSKTFFQNIQKRLSVTYPKMPVSRFVLIAGLVGMSTLCFVLLVANSLLVAAAAGAAGAYMPLFMLNTRYAKRNRTINEQLPESLDFLARILRAGHSLSTGLQMMGTELPAPLASEFQRCYDQHSLGTGMEECLKEMATRVESTEFSFFVTAVLIQRQTGGDLSTVLNNISSTVRGRIRLAGFVKSKTAEGRFTGYVLVFFPILMFFIAYSLNPSYGGKLLHTTTGQKLLASAVALQLIGLFTIKKVTTVKVWTQMFNDAFILSGSLFGAITLLGVWIARLLNGNGDSTRVRDRLSRSDVGGPAATSGNKLTFKDLLSRIGQAASKPFMPDTREKQSELRRRLAMAGIYTPSAVRIITGFKFIFLFLGVLGGYLCGVLMNSVMLYLSIGGIVGYVAPIFWMKQQIKKQQKGLDYGLPDALDLMVVCVEAGLAVDAAMERVGQEFAIVHPRLSRELEITHMETRVGLSRAESLKNLGTRTGCTSLQSLASMLIQADRFGTSIASALKVHAEGMRITRQQKAEEMAAKASVKMSFPLVLFIFPATFIVLAGPTIVELLNSSLFN